MSSDPKNYFGFTFNKFTELECRAFSLFETVTNSLIWLPVILPHGKFRHQETISPPSKVGSCVLLTPAIECRSILAIDTSIDPRSTLDRHLGRPSVDPRLIQGRHLGRQTFNFRWHSMEWRSILAMTTHWMSVDVSIATLRSAVGRMSVVCQWCIGSMSVMYSSQHPSSLGGGLLPYMGYIGMCDPKGYGFSALLVIVGYQF